MLRRADGKVECYCCYSTATKTNLYYSKRRISLLDVNMSPSAEILDTVVQPTDAILTKTNFCLHNGIVLYILTESVLTILII